MTIETTEWWWAEGSEQRGPVSREEILRRVTEGQIGRETLVWHTGMSGWTPASLVPELPFRPVAPPGGGTGTSAESIDGETSLPGSAGVPMDPFAGGADEPAAAPAEFPRPAPPGPMASGGGAIGGLGSGGPATGGGFGAGSGTGTGAGSGGMGAGSVGMGGYGAGLPPRAPGNNMVLAIVATVLCCLPLGIVAIVKASQVKAIAEGGDLARAQKVANEAKAWALWSIGIGLVAQILYMALIGGSALLGLMDGVQDF